MERRKKRRSSEGRMEQWEEEGKEEEEEKQWEDQISVKPKAPRHSSFANSGVEYRPT